MQEFGLAVLHNELARCNTDIGVVAFRLIMMLADKARQDGEFMAVRFKVSDYKEKLQISGKSAYENIYEAVKKLMQTLIETPNPVGDIDMFQVLAPGKRNPEKGEFEVRFNEQMRPLLLNLRAHFAKIPLEIFFRIQGSYAVRFYLFCKSWDPALNHSPGWRMTVAELREWLAIGRKEYEQTFHLRAAIERAKQELNQVADVSFRYDAVMDGKKVMGWDFVPVPNRPTTQILPAKRRSLRRRDKEAQEKLKVEGEENSAFLKDLERIDARWLAADSIERQGWLDAMNEGSRVFAPKPGARPSRVFLTALKGVLEPELALS